MKDHNIDVDMALSELRLRVYMGKTYNTTLGKIPDLDLAFIVASELEKIRTQQKLDEGLKALEDAKQVIKLSNAKAWAKHWKRLAKFHRDDLWPLFIEARFVNEHLRREIERLKDARE